MSFSLVFTDEATRQYKKLKTDPTLHKRLKAVRKTLGLLEVNPRHPGLNPHKYSALKGGNGEEIFEAYAENKTPAAYRIFWHYGTGKGIITILAISPHP
ncbi:MAG: type II toxin-antitoxin system RelE/ParE family toxin [Rickettsiales bacterium]